MPVTAPIQHTGGVTTFTSGTTGVASQSFASNATAGNMLVAAVGFYWGTTLAATITSVTTNGASENWVFFFSDSSNFVDYYINPNTAGGQKIVDVNVSFGGTATTSNSVCVLLDIFEQPGYGATVTLDANANNTGSSNAYSSGATGTTTQTPEIAYGGVGAFPAAANTATTIGAPTGGWTAETALTSSYQSGGTGTADKFDVAQRVGYQLISSLTTVAAFAGTLTNTPEWGACAFTIAPGSATPGGTVQPRPTVALPRRVPSRAISHGLTVQGVSPVPSVQPPGAHPAPRRTPSRAVTRITPLIAGNASAPVGGTTQPLMARPAPRRAPARAYTQGTPMRPVNGTPPAPVGGTLQPLMARPAPRRVLSRAYTRSAPLIAANASPSGSGPGIVQGAEHVISPFAGTINQGSMHVISPHTVTLIQEWDQ